jgi:trehalose synthase
MYEVPLTATSLAPYGRVFGTERMGRLQAVADRTGDLLEGHTLWNVNSTSEGGGVAELLHGLVPLGKALDIDVRWLVLDGDPRFFDITKRLCVRIYGAAGDDGELGPTERDYYRRQLDRNTEALATHVRPGDVVVLHDPQPAGLIDAVRDLGATAVWRCHIGSERDNEHTRQGWEFVRPFVEAADATVFHIDEFVPHWAPRPHIIPPSIDPCRPKNMALDAVDVLAILRRIGVVSGPQGDPVTLPVPVDEPVEVRREARVVRDGPPPPVEAPMVLQLSRWDRLKDMDGVLRAFVEADVPGSYLTLAGADVDGVADDPESADMFEQCRATWAQLAPEHRRRIQLLCLPMADSRENAVMVNALQQHATVVVQKSIAEGFGLTATEAMWKARPVLASAVGGLRTQVTDRETGLVVDDPLDIDAAAKGIGRLLTHPEVAAQLGAAARRRVDEQFLPDRHLLSWAALIADLVTVEVA